MRLQSRRLLEVRILPLGDGDAKDGPEELWVDVVASLPRCIDMIKAVEMIRRIELYFEGGAVSYLTPTQAKYSSDAAS